MCTSPRTLFVDLRTTGAVKTKMVLSKQTEPRRNGSRSQIRPFSLQSLTRQDQCITAASRRLSPTSAAPCVPCTVCAKAEAAEAVVESLDRLRLDRACLSTTLRK